MQDIPMELAETLAAVVDTGTMDAAARRLHITPSAVSQRIRTLEDRLGRVLLVRAKPARPTDAGARVVRLARQYSVLAHDALADLGAGASGEEAGRRVSIPLAVNADSMATWMLPALATVADSQGVVFDLHSHDQDHTAALLEEGEVMAAVTSQEDPVPGCRVSPLGVMRYEAVATPELAERMRADPTAVPVVDFDRRDELQTRWLRARGVDAAVPARHRVPGSHDFAQALVAGLGWGMLPEPQSAEPLGNGRLVRLGGDPVDVPLYWQQWNLESAVLTAVGAELGKEARRRLRPPRGERRRPDAGR
ncbi:LysR family transcriptional regulator ArgP [Microbacterium caowuchunii]|uniref:LysR family transcriptional regulator ArgP n=1 Tax=Microbacterium caowuchunii TaxID=2614638 RepID=A0A5N0TKA9_9MICO|nr:LysR family transcriptional regulator ArgP [Microbacterium caowuchunii]KAA9135613.1 LysR family transcriptional regulator ArgP [Microbacterium caowuchunii]